MSEWIRHRGSKSMPKRLKGKKFMVRCRSGHVIMGEDVLRYNHDGRDGDIMAYRILGDINPPDYSKGFPVGTTAKDIGAKLGDEFLMIDDEHRGAYLGEKVILVEDDGTTSPFFTNTRGLKNCISWDFLSPIPPKTAIELQAEEVGIPEPVRLVDDAKPDADGWIEWKGGDCPVPDGTLVEVKLGSGYTGAGKTAGMWDWHWPSDSSRWHSIVSYRLHQPQEWPEDRVDVIGQNGNDGLHYDDTHLGIKRPDGDGWVKYNAGDAVDLDGVVSIDWHAADGTNGAAMPWPIEFSWLDGEAEQVAWYRLNYRRASQHYTSEQQAAEADKRIDEAAQGVREAIGQNGNDGLHYDVVPTNKYQRTIKGVTVDVYDVLAAFGVTCQARGHAIKKLLMAGQRGHKDEVQDLREAVQAIERSIQLTEGGK